MKIKIYTFAWDNDEGNGCEVYTTLQARNDALRAALMTYVDTSSPYIDRHGNDIDLTSLEIGDLYSQLSDDNELRGARMSWGERIIDASEAEAVS